MNTKTLYFYCFGGAGVFCVLAVAAIVFGGAPEIQRAPEPIAPTEDSEAPAEFARRGLALLKKENEVDADIQTDALKADALIMRAWNLQQSFPESCPSVWEVTKNLVEQQKEPSQKLALTTLYLNSVDAALESAMTPDAFEVSWAVRQAALVEIERHRNDVLAIIERDIKQATELLSQPDGLASFVEGDAARWTELAAELTATMEPLRKAPDKVVQLVYSLSDKLVSVFDEKLAILDGRFRKELATAHGLDPTASSANVDGAGGTPGAPATGPITRLIEDVEQLARMRESASVTAWINLRDTSNETDSPEQPSEKQVAAIEALRGKIFETRALRYNIWAADAIYNAGRRGTDGLLLLGPIETRLLVGVVATSYSITESRLMNEIQDPSQRQLMIRTLLRATKKQLMEF